MENNLYGGNVGEKAGVFVKDAVEINGVMESSIGLRPKVIEAIQKKIMEEDEEITQQTYNQIRKFPKAYTINHDASAFDLPGVPASNIIFSMLLKVDYVGYSYSVLFRSKSKFL